ncbi:RagB/SusD family nutrient uptake outer membrane protein [Mucilaginibacter calamicampi]|uniref:RagB/SusD family nutrient uptake outer membrane protein n=1 Tax=Mucilaginibacter calamicampi TaxID=1302352 RepID=A0ABW2YWE2_9SPHI
MRKLIILLAVLSCVSCKKGILDITPLDKVSEDAVWSDENLIRAYEAELYNAIPHGMGVHGMLSKHTDEAVNTVPNGQPPYVFARGTLTPDNVTTINGGNWDNQRLYYWDYGYQYIRKINVFFEQLGTTKVVLADKARLIAEAKFVRAYTYFQLLERFGGVPIVEQTYQLANGAAVKFKRATIDETVAYIDKNLTEALPDLPQKYAAQDANFGRATKDACLALRSRVYLYAASPLYSPTKDNAKWQKAADAAAALLTSGYSLYPDYKAAFNRSSGSTNDELIFAKNFTTANGHQAPMNNLGRRYQAYGGWWASNGPSQNLVDDYDMTNGLQPFTVTGTGTAVAKTVNALSGYNAQKPYLNRDPRFDATVIHDETTFHGDFYEMWVSSDNKTWGFDSYKQSSDNPRCNYILKKFMPEDQPLNWQTTYTQPWPIFRLAEIYLNYAEAKFELGDEATAREYVNKVRARPSVNLPPIPATVTGEALRKRIYNERRIELAFESHRFFDIRRWKIAIDIENRPVYGMDIIKDVTTGVKTYTPIKQIEHVYEDKMNWLPIEANEIRRNPDIAQIGW